MQMATMKMAAASRSFQAMRAHTPLIKFRKGGSTSKDSLEATGPAPAKASTPRIVATKPRGLVIDDCDLPRKYARKPLSEVEIQYIMRGGPE